MYTSLVTADLKAATFYAYTTEKNQAPLLTLPNKLAETLR